jgi:hypothetical protein
LKPQKFTIPDDDGTGFLHMSRKENLFAARPTNFFDDDLNMEKFSLALGTLTLLVDAKKPAPVFDDFNLSVAMNENEMKRLGAKTDLKVPSIPPPKPMPKFEDDDDDDLGKSIYVARPEIEEEEEKEWSGEDNLMVSFVAHGR